MDFWKAGEALLRNQSSLLPFLAPTLLRQPARTRSSLARSGYTSTSIVSSVSTTSCRSLSSTSARNAEDSPSNPASNNDAFAKLLTDGLDFSSNTRTTQRTSRFKSAGQQARNRDSAPATGTGPTGSSYDDILKGFYTGQSLRPNTPQRQTRSGLDVARMTDPQRNTAAPVATAMRLPEPLRVRLGPALGRTVPIDANKGTDLARAMRTLDMACARNKVRADFARQRFHERPGLKRKRLKSERWRRRFREGFKGMLTMVNEMRKKGW